MPQQFHTRCKMHRVFFVLSRRHRIRIEMVGYRFFPDPPGDEQAPACTEFALGWSVI